MTSDQCKIATHNGKFHVDEVCAYAMLNYLIPNNVLIRTRDPVVMQNSDFVIDVGQIYDHDKCRYDHHQSTFNVPFNDKSYIKLSASGLIYKHYGQLLIDKYCQSKNIIAPTNAHIDLYYRFFIEIDAFDNGIRQYSDNFYDQLDNKTITQKFYSNTSLGQIVEKLNTSTPGDHESQYIAFNKAAQLVWQILCISIDSYLEHENAMAKDQSILDQAMIDRFQHYPTGEIIVVDQDCNNWRKCLSNYENKNVGQLLAKFIVYKNANNSWNIKTISDQLFKNRLNLLESSIMKNMLSNPKDFIFVHNNLFIAGCSTLESTIEMGRFSLQKNNNST